MITLKGSPKGIMISIDDVSYETGRQELEEKLIVSRDFFKGTEVSIFLSSNTLTEAEVFFLRDTVVRVLADSVVTFIESAPKMLPKTHSDLEDLAEDESVTKFVRKTVKSGETVKSKYSLVVIGDVEEGATVEADGSVIVLGKLAGTVCAGKNGKRDSVVVAMRLMPEKLSICELSVSVKKNVLKKLYSTKPEIAYVYKSTIKVEQYT